MGRDVTKPIRQVSRAFIKHSRLGKIPHYLASRGRPNAVFIWIPKNAGSSLFWALAQYGCIKAKNLSLVRYRFSQRGLVTFSHMDYRKLVEKGHVSARFDATAYKFCFSRNPYDRAVSLYEYLTKKMEERPSFLRFWQLLRDNGVEPIGLYNVRGMSQCNPQVRWIENVCLDGVGGYESLAEDVRRFANDLSLPDMDLGHLNKSVRKGLSSYYCPASKQIIEEIYAEDFRYFGYPIEDAVRIEEE